MFVKLIDVDGVVQDHVFGGGLAQVDFVVAFNVQPLVGAVKPGNHVRCYEFEPGRPELNGAVDCFTDASSFGQNLKGETCFDASAAVVVRRCFIQNFQRLWIV